MCSLLKRVKTPLNLRTESTSLKKDSETITNLRSRTVLIFEKNQGEKETLVDVTDAEARQYRSLSLSYGLFVARRRALAH
jgi:hypothetical protein